MRGKLILWLVLLLAGFLGGFIPQYLRASRMEAELARLRQEAVTSQRRLDLADIRDQAAHMYLETLSKNYGLAMETAVRFFKQVRNLSDSAQQNEQKTALAEVLSMQDRITTGLAQTDPAVQFDLQTLLEKTRQVPSAPVKP